MEIKRVIALSPNYYAFDVNKVATFKEDRSGIFIIDNKPHRIDKILEENLDTNILIYEDRTLGWFLNPAKSLVANRQAGFVILMICASYLEGNQQFREGRKSKHGESSSMLLRALKRIFKITKDNSAAIDLFVKEVRNGLFHEGMTRKNVIISSDTSSPLTIGTDRETITINPRLFLSIIENDFSQYLTLLKDKTRQAERSNFDKCWDEMYG